MHRSNISHLKLDEDETSFYLIREILQEVRKIDNSIFEEYDEKFQYQKLLECYLQIFKAIKHIHHKDFYHGNINPSNILINENNQAFLLDFGKSYFYESLKTNSNQNIDERFYAPDQIKDVSNVDAKSDIYAFGLCILKIFLDSLPEKNIKFENLYTYPRDLKRIFEAVTEQFDLEDKEKDLFALIQQMTIEEPQNPYKLRGFRCGTS
ncbi:protein kinase domain-containing protein [Helicobacter apodemus]|uniref:protein kinase domain-containing protein n=1 Tax=Helicobacter apodemus TaxID=135569 RepID=UPI001EF3A619|nr:protein kinase [Helicobacter apodemus]